MPKGIPSKKTGAGKTGRVIRQYKRMIPVQDFNAWKEHIRRRVRGCGLYALYDGQTLVYVGLATQSLRGRIGTHIKEQKKHFTHFSVFLVTGTSKTRTAQGRRIRDLEALILKIMGRRNKPKHNRNVTNFVAAKRLTLSTPISLNEE